VAAFIPDLTVAGSQMRAFLRTILYCTAMLVSVCFSRSPLQAGTFKNPELIPTSTDVLWIATADVNHDGKLDLVYVDGLNFSQRTVHVLLGRGDGTFSHGEDINLPPGVGTALTIADVTNDGNLDLLLAGSDMLTANVAVLVGKGDGTFQAPLLTTFQSPNSAGFPGFRSMAVGDINGDGKADLALLDYSNAVIYTLLGNNTGNFTFSSTIQSFTRGTVSLVDLNGDGKLDILTTDPIGATFLVYLGKGDGTFPTFTRYSVNTSAGPFLLVDLNGDGHPDVLVTYNPGLIGYFPGNPDGTFGALVPLGNTPSPNQLVSVGDLNGDGIPDLTFITASGIAVALGKSGINFGNPLTTISGGSTSPYSELPIIPVTGDFNVDGHIDLAMPVEGGIEILLGKGDGTFLSTDFYDMGQEVGAAAVANFSGHSFPDIAVTLPATFPRLLLGNGTGTFTLGPDPNTSYASGGADITLLAADFNGDGRPDLNIGDGLQNEAFAGTQSVAINAGNGTFLAPVSVPNTSPIMADFNHDGRTDIVDLSGGQIVVSLGQPDGSFKTVTTALRIPGDSGHFNVGDVNKDGKPDLIINYLDHLEVWFGNGDGTFTYANSVNLYVQNVVSDFVAVVSDLDGDGNPDIVLTPDADPAAALSPLAFLYGNGDGTFQAPVFLPVSHRYSWITVADLNGDGEPDLVLTDGACVAVMMNLGGRKFDAEVDYIAGRSISVPVNVVDVNGDGFPDIVVANTSGTTVTLLLNEPNGTSANGAPVSGSLTVAPEPSIFGQSFVATLSVSGQTSGLPVPTGSVDFYVDGAFVATANMSGGSASYTDSNSLVAGQHTIVASYSGDSRYAPKSFSVIHTIQPPVYATHTTLAVSPLTVLASQTVRLTATVASTPPVPAGVVTFLDGTSTIGSASLNSSGNAFFDTALLGPGTHSLSATYDGYTQVGFTGTSATYTAAIFSPSTSTPTSVVVNVDGTSTTLSASSTSPTSGTVVTFTTNVTSAAGAPFGGVTFYDGSTVLGTSDLQANDSASFSTASLSAGTHSINAAFNANGPFAGSTSPIVSVSVSAAPANAHATVVSLAPETNLADGSSTLAANVGALTGEPRGTVTFLDSGAILGTAETNESGNAILPVGKLGSGTHNFSVSFGGGPDIAPSASPEFRDQWPETGPGFSVNATERTLHVSPGGSDSVSITIAPIANFRQEVQLFCAAGLPGNYTCDFSPATLTGGGVSILTIRTSAKTAVTLPETISLYAITFGTFSVLMLAGCDWRRAVALLLVCSSLFLLGACSIAPSSGTQTQMIVLTVRATSGSGTETIVHSTQFAVLVRN
jgi:hypothetical protein